MPDSHDIFVSYAHKDAGRVKPIVKALRGKGLQVWFDESDIEDFASITKAITKGLAQSKALLAFYSAAYPTRRPCQWELTAGFLAAQHEGDLRKRVLVVNPESGAAHIHPVELRDALFRKAPGPDDKAGQKDLAEAVQNHISQLDGPLGDIRPLTPPRWYGMKGVGSSRFVGRVEELWKIHSGLQASEAAIITGKAGSDVAQVRGMGGIGKSLLAEEYALRFGAAYPGGVFWLRAYGNDDAKAELSAEEREAERHGQVRGFAALMGIVVEGQSPEQIEGALAYRIEERKLPCLWVVDDVPSGLDGQALRKWFAPAAAAKTLLTTRSRGYDFLGDPVDLSVLDPEEAYQLLTARRAPDSPEEEQAARGIAEDLGYHALAIDVAAGALKQSAGLWSFAGYRETLGEPREDALEFAKELAPELPNGHERSIAKTLLLSIEQLGEEGMDFLRLASRLAVAPIPARFVAGAFASADGLEGKAARRKAAKALHQADGLSLTEQPDGQEGSRTVHTLISRTTRFQDSRPERAGHLAGASVQVLNCVMPGVVDPRSHEELSFEVTHARKLTRDPEDQAQAVLLGWVARHDYVQGNYHVCGEAYRHQFELRQRLLGADHPDTLISMGNLASIMQAQGNLTQARRLQEELLDIHRRVLGAEHPDTLKSMNNLAETLRAQGHLAEARQLHQRELEICKRVLGSEHPDTLMSMSNLALTLGAQGDLGGARRLHEEVLGVRKRVLGADHPDTLTSMNNLAEILRGQKDLAGARRLQEEALEVQKRVLGAEHPDTLRSMNNLSETLRAQGHLAEARQLHQQELKICKRVLGVEHPETLISMGNLASTMSQQEDLVGARRLHEEVLGAQRRLLGPEHPHTSISASNLFNTLVQLEDGEAASEVLKNDLVWLVGRDPESLGADQRKIREMVQEFLKRTQGQGGD